MSPFNIGGGGGGSGGATKLLFSGGGYALGVTLAGAHAIGATVLTVNTAAKLKPTHHLYVGISVASTSLETHKVLSVDKGANQITIAAPGLVAARPSGAKLSFAPMFGRDSEIILPPAPSIFGYNELEIEYLYDLPQVTGNVAYYSGRGSGGFKNSNGDHVKASWYKTLTNYSYWHANTQIVEDNSYTIGLIHGSSSLGVNDVYLEYHIADNKLLLADIKAGVPIFSPRIYALILRGS